MSTENQKRTLIALGAFSQVIGGGGDIPEDLTLNSLTACTISAGQIGACSSCSTIEINPHINANQGISVYGSIFANGPLVMQDCSSLSSIQIEISNGDLVANGDLVHIVGTRPLINGCTLRSGRYYYLNAACESCFDFGDITVAENETAEIWLEIAGTAPQNFTLPSCWKWVGSGCGCGMTLEANHFYDLAARHIKNIGTVANLAFDLPVESCN